MAAAAKQKGNEAFGAGDFPAAIGHYTSAVLADPSNPIYPLNRAAAYLKLGKYQDAERDCTTVIRLDARNPKAWYRRAQARQGLDLWDDALDDYRQVLVLEPSNALVKQDIERVQFLIKNGKKPTRRSAAEVLAPPQPANPPRRRRVPIAIIDTDDSPKSSSSVDFMAPISTRKLNDNIPAPSPPKATPPASSSPSRPGGGIFRKDGSHKIVGDQQPSNPANSNDQAHLKVDILPGDFSELSMKATQTVPTSLYAFDRNWSALKTPASRWQYLKQIAPESLPSLFKTSLDPSMLGSIITTFHAAARSGVEPSVIKAYMTNLPRVSRWATVVLLLSNAEIQMVKEIWDVLPVDPGDEGLRDSWGLRS
ncbi:hypothetical protein BXZ70DRAFT_1013068 [Cristinia sonorae]|uniref:RNA polymerase II-associated protein 3 n=1 Tax=Cristinia sonorae TaxID=1940300 RepID=A0A8K0UE99_9AGAR|nr:hypothetical protein BXZ70DRAFT_1013068 [Cristinia sonorae]